MIEPEEEIAESQVAESTEADIPETVEPVPANEEKTPVDQWIEQVDANKHQAPVDMHVVVNGTPVSLTGKANYVFVDIFEKYAFDLKSVKGTMLVQKIDGDDAEHFSALHEGANIELYWKD